MLHSLTRRDGTSTNSGAQDELETLRRQLEEVQRKSETEIKALTLEVRFSALLSVVTPR